MTPNRTQITDLPTGMNHVATITNHLSNLLKKTLY